MLAFRRKNESWKDPLLWSAERDCHRRDLLPRPKEAELVVGVASAGVGPWDALLREGKIVVQPSLPIVLGSDLAGTNVEAYPKWQAWMREHQPRLLVLWGKHDLSFDPSEPEAYRRDLPNAEVHVLDAVHFALDTAADQIAGFVRSFVR